MEAVLAFGLWRRWLVQGFWKSKDETGGFDRSIAADLD